MSSRSSGFQLAMHQATGYESFTSTFMDGSARLLAEGAGIGPTDVVLDLACGTGLVARQVLALVGTAGQIIGTDINPAMLGVARTAVAAVTWCQASVDALPFDDALFTHVICQQGFQFFPDPVRAATEVRRVLRPGGALIATIWATPGHNPYIENQLDLLAAIEPSLLPSVQRATPQDADVLLRSMAERAGLTATGIRLIEHTVRIPDLRSWFLAQTATTPWAPVLSTLSESATAALSTELERRLSSFAEPDGAHVIPFASHRLEAYRSS